MPAACTLAAIWHNKGAAFAGLMRYDQAAECFRHAYELGGGPDSCVSYLAAMRMQLSEQEYEDFMAEHGDMVQDNVLMKEKWERLTAEWEQKPDCLRLNNRSRLRERDRQKYMEETERLVQALKDNYRRTIEA